MKVLFIHRSVGRDIIKQGKLRDVLAEQGIMLDDYDNNSGLLTLHTGETLKNTITIPGNNTNPDNLASFFNAWSPVLDDYDLVVIKSCYPNSHIKDESELEEIKESYAQIIQSFVGRNKQLLILTSPPLRPLLTNEIEARLSSQLAYWLVSRSSENIEIFDFHHALSEPEGRHAGMLKRSYRRLLPFDNHPNRKAHIVIAPQVAKKIEEVFA